ncbi:MAG: hypothetical protein KKF68_03895 [Nanoarchaeota archaeon]|nr:hypothetical protein [Nanoarchaeota archaeon]
METKPREEIAIGLFTGSIIALFIIIGDLAKSIFQKLLIIFILIELIIISLKVIRCRSTDMHFIGDILKKVRL